MSRAININATEAHVRATCEKHKATITAIETLRSGGTRVVLSNIEHAEAIGGSYGNKVISGPVRRTPIVSNRM